METIGNVLVHKVFLNNFSFTIVCDVREMIAGQSAGGLDINVIAVASINSDAQLCLKAHRKTWTSNMTVKSHPPWRNLLY